MLPSLAPFAVEPPPLSGTPDGGIPDEMPVDALPPSLLGYEREIQPDWRPRPAVRPKFSAGEQLWMARALPATPNGATLIGEVSSQLGDALRDRYQWDRPAPMQTEAINRLLKSPSLQGRPSLNWYLRVDAREEQVLMVVRSGSTPLESAPVLDLRQTPSGMLVLSLDRDPRLEAFHRQLSDRFNGEGWNAETMSGPDHLQHHAQSPRPLHGLPAQMRVTLIGHGERKRAGGADVPFSTDRLAGMNVKAMADRLETLGLEKSFDGTLYLESCDSGAGFSNGTSFSQALLSELTRRGYRKLRVAGVPGNTYVDAAGHNYSAVSALKNDHALALKQTERLVKRLRKEFHRHEAALASRPPMAPEEVAAHQDGADSLQRVLAKERAHIDGLKTLGHLTKMERKKEIDKDAAWPRYVMLTHVRDWWGHLGPAPAPVSWLRSQWDRMRGRA